MKIMASVGIMGIFLATGCFAQTTLKDAFKKDFLIGAALNEAEFTGRNTNAVAIVKAQFNSISPENALKWESIHPRPDQYDFSAADRYVEFGQKNKMFIVGGNEFYSCTFRYFLQNSIHFDLAFIHFVIQHCIARTV